MTGNLIVAGHTMSCGAAAAPMANERESGDRYVVQPSGDGVLIAAVDGAGHGAEAAAAARIAAATLETFARESPIELMLRCHEELKRTRGAVMTLVFVHLRHRTLTWLGVGNVEAMLFRGDRAAVPDRALLRAGVIGYQLPTLSPEVIPLKPFDTIILATDGIRSDFAEGLALGGNAQQIADRILADHGKGTDDALVVVARYLGADHRERPSA
jgi:negative regulator of sigma-B (phosphoserine phosphatase)